MITGCDKPSSGEYSKLVFPYLWFSCMKPASSTASRTCRRLFQSETNHMHPL